MRSNTAYTVATVVIVGLSCAFYWHHSTCFKYTYIEIPPEETKHLQNAFSAERKSAVMAQNFSPMKFENKRNDSFDHIAAMKVMNDAKVSQDDPRLIHIIRNYYIHPPSEKPYNLLNPDRLEYSNGQTPFVDSRLNYTEGGFYIECGALNGEKGSNTLFFEKVRKWNGLLIEADPTTFLDLKSKNRKAFIMNVCLSPLPHPSVMTFNKAYNRGRVVHNADAARWIKQQHIAKDEVQIQCFPLYSILLALNQLTVDFLSLDIEGDELNVLKTVPWKNVNIRMMTVEYVHETGSSGELKKYVEGQGYEALLQVSRWDGGVNDIIFRKAGLTH